MTTTLQAEALQVIEANEAQASFSKELSDKRAERHESMVSDLHRRCEEKKEAMREARFWDSVNEEAQELDFDY